MESSSWWRRRRRYDPNDRHHHASDRGELAPPGPIPSCLRRIRPARSVRGQRGRQYGHDHRPREARSARRGAGLGRAGRRCISPTARSWSTPPRRPTWRISSTPPRARSSPMCWSMRGLASPSSNAMARSLGVVEVGGTVSIIDPAKHTVTKKITFDIPGCARRRSSRSGSASPRTARQDRGARACQPRRCAQRRNPRVQASSRRPAPGRWRSPRTRNIPDHQRRVERRLGHRRGEPQGDQVDPGRRAAGVLRSPSSEDRLLNRRRGS